MARLAIIFCFITALIIALPPLTLASKGQLQPDLPPARITIDLDSAAVLEADNADSLRWPASIAKLMTLYLAFEALESGDVRVTSPVVISKRAASRPPSSLGLREGVVAEFGALMGAAAIASANDAAVAIAERLAGSETLFVERMNATAARLGMTNTLYANSSGLPQPGQQTTARDVAILAHIIFHRFPLRARLFARQSGAVGDIMFATTNSLLAGYNGAMGMKTGFTCRAGYNLVAAAKKDDRRLLAVSLGHRSGAQRRRAITRQLDRGFGMARHQRNEVRPVLKPAIFPTPLTRPPSADACAPSRLAGLRGLSGWGVFLGARANRQEALAQLSQAVAASKTRGLEYVGPRKRDGRWVAVLNGYDQAEAIRVCAAYRRSGGYCLPLSPEVLKNNQALWR